MSSRISLDELLESRDRRWAFERKLIAENEGKTEIVLTVVMPGSVKRNERSLIVANAAVEALWQELGCEPTIIKDLKTGFEAYWLVDGNAKELKQRTCRIEESHPLGRLFDIDVLLPDATPISRQSIGLSPRRCLVCNREARFCMRNHSHTQEEIQEKINQLIKSFQLSNSTH